MYTVIIAEKKHFDAIEHNKLYFKPFLDRLNKEFAFCEWIPAGETLYDCVPTLVRTVGRHKTWRAVIIKDDSLSSTKNPFDAISYETIFECEERNRIVNPLDEADDAQVASSAAGNYRGDLQESFNRWKAECSERMNSLLHDKEEIFRAALDIPFQRLATCLCYIFRRAGWFKCTKEERC